MSHFRAKPKFGFLSLSAYWPPTSGDFEQKMLEAVECCQRALAFPVCECVTDEAALEDRRYNVAYCVVDYPVAEV